VACRWTSTARAQCPSSPTGPTHWDGDAASLQPCSGAQPRGATCPNRTHTRPPCIHSLSLTCTYNIWGCMHGVLSLQD
jgi:hypothetical protein